MALLSVIRRWHHRDGIGIRDIARRTGLSRNTVRKYLASQILEPHYPKRITPTKLDDYEATLTSWLHREAKRHRKNRRSVKQLYRDLIPLGYSGSYDRVAAFAKHWRRQQMELTLKADKQAYIPLSFAPGEAFQFDWSEDWALIAGVKTKLQVAHTKLSHSRVFAMRAYLQQTHEMLFDAHEHAFALFGGVPERGIYDNMKTAVDKVIRGKLRQVNKRFEAMASHYLFEAQFCNPASGWEKGQVEKAVRDARHSVWQHAPAFDSLDSLNIWLQERCKQLWFEQTHPEDKQRTLGQCWLEERSHLMPMPVPFDGFIEHSKRVSSTCLITFEQNRYSVPASFANRVISLRVYPQRLVIVAEAQVVAEHTRVFTRDHSVQGKTVYNWRHYLAVAQRKPGALRNGAPFNELPESFQRLQQILLRRLGGDREMVEILALVLLHDERLVERAIEQALISEQPSKQHVLNCLSRLDETPRPDSLELPQQLRLRTEPQANTARYDYLRGAGHEH